MFKSICLRFNQNSFPTDVGLIAESLLYYDQVIILGRPDILPLILDSVSKDVLIDLLLKKSLRFCILEYSLGVSSRITEHGSIPNNILLMKDANVTTEGQIFDSLYKFSGKRGQSKRLLSHILPYIELTNYPKDITQVIKTDLYNSDYVKRVFIEIIKNYLPNLELTPNQFALEFTEAEKTSFGFRSTLDLNKIEKLIHDSSGQNKFDLSSVVSAIQSVRGDLYLSSLYDSELVTTPLNASIIKFKFEDIYERDNKSRENIQSFNDLVLDNGYAIREAINSGNYSLDEFKKILDKSTKFKGWLQNKSADANLVKEYHNAVTRKTWLEKLPTKLFRWSIFTWLGMQTNDIKDLIISQGLSMALGASDTFLIDKILGGWKPDLFIENDLKKIK